MKGYWIISRWLAGTPQSRQGMSLNTRAGEGEGCSLRSLLVGLPRAFGWTRWTVLGLMKQGSSQALMGASGWPLPWPVPVGLAPPTLLWEPPVGHCVVQDAGLDGLFLDVIRLGSSSACVLQ